MSFKRLMAGIHCLRQQCLCVAEPVAFYFGAKVNRLVQPRSLREQRSSCASHTQLRAGAQLENKILAYFSDGKNYS